MASAQSGSPVAEAAEWLTRQGIAVPSPAGPAEPSAPAQSDRSNRSVVPGGLELAAVVESRQQKARGSNRDADPDADADPYSVARSIALDRIAARDRTRSELEQTLQAKNVPTDIAEQVLDRLEEVGLVNDAAFAEAWVESRQQRRHLSRPALRRELQAKGVDRDQIDAALDTVDFGDELVAARELARRRHSAIAELPFPVRYRRLAGVLGRRGFSAAIITQVLREVLGTE